MMAARMKAGLEYPDFGFAAESGTSVKARAAKDP